jgi:hypothetical protein
MAYIEKRIYSSILSDRFIHSDGLTLRNDPPYIAISPLHLPDNLSHSLLMTDSVRPFPVEYYYSKANTGSFRLPSCVKPPK